MTLSRRRFLGLPGLVKTRHAGRRPVLVNIFLRGGMDGLHAVPAFADEDYYTLRPRIAIPAPGEKKGAFDLDGFFGLHSELAPLFDLFKDKKLAIVHACGGPDLSLSHFEAQRNMELGVPVGAEIGSGWMTRLLRTEQSASSSPLSAIALGEQLPDALVGGSGALVLPNLADYRLKLPAGWRGEFSEALFELYERGTDSISRSGLQTKERIRVLSKLAGTTPEVRGGANYPDSIFGRQLRELAAVIRADLGLRVAQVDLDGWDTHIDQPPRMAALMRELGQGMTAFYQDLGDVMERVTVVAMSEFGRRVAGVGGLGTDHGRGGACFVLGDGVQGGKVYTKWPGLTRSSLDRDGNLPVTVDYRDVFAEVLTERLGVEERSAVFPSYEPTPIGIV
ncbi:MAG: hypothetical protein ACI9EF_003117 [Pseudohongiellaceae bacterium]|jgi:uncharacterized protein (DUF1501 family)